LTNYVPPIAGPGTEVFGFAAGWCWCGYCGYTGRVEGPRQKACKQWIWHGWLKHCAELELPWIPYEERKQYAERTS